MNLSEKPQVEDAKLVDPMDQSILQSIATETLTELSNAILDIPAQLENLSRVTLAANFIHREKDGSHSFDESAFNNAWNAICGETEEETDPENDEN